MTRDKALAAIIQEAFSVATNPSVAAYRKGNATHGISRRRLRRLLDALAELPTLTDEARGEIADRQKAFDKAEDDRQRWAARHGQAS